MNAGKQNNVMAGDMRKEFLEIEKLRKSAGQDNAGAEGFTKYSGGVYTFICC